MRSGSDSIFSIREQELLQRGDDYPGLLPHQRFGQLVRVLVDPLYDPDGVLELADHILELAVEDAPVGDHHHFVEDSAVLGVMHGREPVSQPGDRVGLARTRRVLNQIVNTFRLVLLHQLRGQPACGPEERQLYLHVPIHDPTPQDIHRRPLIELRSQPLDETRTRQGLVTAVPRIHQAIPPPALGRLHELEQINRVHPGYRIEVGLTSEVPTFTRR